MKTEKYTIKTHKTHADLIPKVVKSLSIELNCTAHAVSRHSNGKGVYTCVIEVHSDVLDRRTVNCKIVELLQRMEKFVVAGKNGEPTSSYTTGGRL